jgi:hypothetical protein
MFPHRSGWPHYTEPEDCRGGRSKWIYKWISRLTEEGLGMEFDSNNNNNNNDGLDDELAK